LRQLWFPACAQRATASDESPVPTTVRIAAQAAKAVSPTIAKVRSPRRHHAARHSLACIDRSSEEERRVGATSYGIAMSAAAPQALSATRRQKADTIVRLAHSRAVNRHAGSTTRGAVRPFPSLAMEFQDVFPSLLLALGGCIAGVIGSQSSSSSHPVADPVERGREDRGSDGMPPASSWPSSSRDAAPLPSLVTELTPDNLVIVLGTALTAVVEQYPATAATHNAAIAPFFAASEAAASQEAAAAAILAEAARVFVYTSVDKRAELPWYNLIVAVNAYTPARRTASTTAAAVAGALRPLPVEPASFPPADDPVAVFFGDEPTADVGAFVGRLVAEAHLSPSAAADAVALLSYAAEVDPRLTPHVWTVSRVYTVAAWFAAHAEVGGWPDDDPAWAFVGGFQSPKEFYAAVAVLRSVLGQLLLEPPSARVCMRGELIRHYNEVAAARGVPSG